MSAEPETKPADCLHWRYVLTTGACADCGKPNTGPVVDEPRVVMLRLRLLAAGERAEEIRARVYQAQTEWFKDSHSAILQDLDSLLLILKSKADP